MFSVLIHIDEKLHISSINRLTKPQIREAAFHTSVIGLFKGPYLRFQDSQSLFRYEAEDDFCRSR